MSCKERKSIFRRWWFWAIAVIVVFGAASGGGEDQPVNTTATVSQASQAAETKKEESKQEEPKNKPSMSKAEFDQIQIGMTYEEAIAIIGGPGELMSETGTKGDQYYTAMYSFEGDGGFGANAILTSQGGKMMNKTQMGLK